MISLERVGHEIKSPSIIVIDMGKITSLSNSTPSRKEKEL